MTYLHPGLKHHHLNIIEAQASTQLGTAAWLPEGSPAIPPFQTGAFWLGRDAGGTAVGVRGDGHVLVDCGTRGGKGTSIIIPNLCLWPGSVVVIDPKGENAMITARRRGNGSRSSRGMGQKVRILDPFGAIQTPEDSFSDLKASFNPLDALNVDDEESIDTSDRIADSFVVSEKATDPFWEDSGRDAISKIQLHVVSAPEFAPHERNLLKVRELIVAGDLNAAGMQAAAQPNMPAPSGFAMLFASMQRNPSFGGVVARAGAQLAALEQNSPRLFESIMQVARTNTAFLDSPGMRRVLAKSDFQLSELKTDPKGTSLFISLPQRYFRTHYRWLRMMTTLVTTEMERVRRQPACGHPVLMILDEFPALKRMQTIENAAAQIAGFGVKLVFVVQTLAQLKEEYKENWETLVANAGLKLFFCNDDHFTRDYASKLIGERELVRYTKTASETRGTSDSVARGYSSTYSSGNSFSTNKDSGSFGWNSGRSVTSSFTQTHGTNHSQTVGYNETLHKRALVTPDEVGRLFGNRKDPKALVLLSGLQPASITRTHYYEDYSFYELFDRHVDHSQTAESAQRELQMLMAVALQSMRKDEAQIRADHQWDAIIARCSMKKPMTKRRVTFWTQIQDVFVISPMIAALAKARGWYR